MRSINAQTDEVTRRLDALNSNLITVLSIQNRVPRIAGGGDGGFASELLSNIGRVANF